MPSILEAAVHSAREWCAVLRRRSAELRAQALGPELAEPALDLAFALEVAEADRTHAVEMYLVAWKAARAHPQALARARALCLELGQFATAAKVARIEYQRGRDARYLLAEGNAWLDANQPDRAVRALMAAARALPGDRLAELALHTARQEWPDVRREVAGLEADADREPPELASELLVQAARIARMVGTEESEEEYGRLLHRAFEISPQSGHALALLEDWLVSRGDRSGLTRIYEVRAKLVPEEELEILRRGGTKLVLGGNYTGLGMHFLAAALERAYQGRLRPIPGHLAMLWLLRQFSEKAGLDDEFLSLLSRGLMAEQPAVEQTAMAVLGLEIAWSKRRDAGLAYPYASVLAGLCDSHPSLAAFYREGGMALGEAMHRQKRAEEPGLAYLDEVSRPEPGDESEGASLEAAAGEGDPNFGSAAGAETAPPEVELEPEELEELQPDDLEELQPDDLEELQPDDLEELRPDDLEELQPDDLEELQPADLEPEVPAPVSPDAKAEPAARGGATGEAPPEPKPRGPGSPPGRSMIPKGALSALQSGRPALPVIRGTAPSGVQRAERLPVSADVRVHVPACGGAPARRFSCVTRDVSETGVFLVPDEELDLEIETELELSIALSKKDDWAVETYELRGRVARRTNRGYGIHLMDPLSDFVRHVRDLCQSNA